MCNYNFFQHLNHFIYIFLLPQNQKRIFASAFPKTFIQKRLFRPARNTIHAHLGKHVDGGEPLQDELRPPHGQNVSIILGTNALPPSSISESQCLPTFPLLSPPSPLYLWSFPPSTKLCNRVGGECIRGKGGGT